MDNELEDRKLGDDEKAWLLIVLIDVVATAAVFAFFLWYSALVAA